MSCPYCHNKLMPSDDVVWQPFEDERIRLHQYCYNRIIAELEKIRDEEKQQSFLRKVLRHLSMACILFILAIPLHGDDVKPEKEWVKGAAVIGVSNAGNCVFRPFVVVGDADNDPDTGEGKLLGFEPGNVHWDRQGRIIWEHLPEAVFIPLHGFKSVRGRLCKAPPYNE